MRTIKFRAWDNINKRMGYFKEGFHWNSEYNLWYLLPIDYKNEDICDVPFNDTIVLQQFTGLKDKNGKEIYEGDIVLVNHPQDTTGDFTNSKQKVIFYEGCFCHGNGERPPKTMWEYCEVIGNIYENPELLREKK